MTTALMTTDYTSEQVSLIKRTIAKGASDDELLLFVAQCKRTGLDPFSRQIYAIKRWDSKEKREVMTVQVGIDGFRLVAERTGKYAGQLGPLWCGQDGVWVDVWLAETPPAAAKVAVLKEGCKEPFWAVARYGAYVQTTKEGGPTRFWQRMPDVMLAKCAESLALRKAFPQELSGLYTPEETQFDPAPEAKTNGKQLPEPKPAKKPASKTAPPATTEEMIERLQAKDDWLAKQGKIESGALIAYVRDAVKALPPDGLGKTLEQAGIDAYPLISNVVQDYINELNAGQPA